MAEFSRAWVTTLTDKVDRAVKSQSAKDLRALKSAITKEINAMKSYEKYVEKTYGTAGTEYQSEEFQFTRKAQKQLLSVRKQLDEKLKEPSAHRVSYFKVLNLANEAEQRFTASIQEVLQEQREKGRPTPKREAIRRYTANNVDNIFVDMFHKTKRSDFRILGQALQQADKILALAGIAFNVTDKVKEELTDNYEDLSSDTAYAVIIGVYEELEEYANTETELTDEQIEQLENAIDILQGAI